MVVTPNEVRNAVAEEQKFKDLEVRVDAFMIELAKVGASYPFELDAEKLGYGVHRDMIIEKYRASGWDVTHRWIDGDYGADRVWYEFSPRKSEG